LISSRISAKGQITLPRKIRELLAVGPGDRIVFAVDGDSILLRQLGPCTARDLAGSLRQYARKTRDGKEVVRTAVKKGVADAAAREN
jgi:AbrB family looped-hinge helix DNA binding protein